MTVLGCLAICASGCAEPPPRPAPAAPAGPGPAVVSDPADLRVYLGDYPLVYEDPELFLLDVFFENRGSETLVILPSLLRRHYSPMDDTGMVTYVPRSEPTGFSWDGAFTLRPQETKVLTLSGMEDIDGVWELERGFYRLSVRYVVPEGLILNGAHGGAGSGPDDGVLWIGEQESQELTVRYEPEGAQ